MGYLGGRLLGLLNGYDIGESDRSFWVNWMGLRLLNFMDRVWVVWK